MNINTKDFRDGKKTKRNIKYGIILFVILFFILLLFINLSEEHADLQIPVQNASKENWNRTSFWHTPWGKTKIHMGLDIFAAQKTPIVSPVNGLILSTGYSENGGNYIYLIGAKLRIYYFAHLNQKEKNSWAFVKKGERLGAVGNSGNAIGSPYHLHFSIFSLIPIVKNYCGTCPAGWKKMFYLDPNKYFTSQ